LSFFLTLALTQGTGATHIHSHTHERAARQAVISGSMTVGGAGWWGRQRDRSDNRL